MDTIPKQEPYITSLNAAWYQSYVQKVDILRLDMIHPVVSGNKWYKLKGNIEYALANKYSAILTFGGAYSNHLVATAAAAKQFGLRAIGIVRGLYAQSQLTTTLQACIDNNMQLIFVSREEYRRKQDADYLQHLSDEYGHPFIIPEGGANEWGREGCEAIASFIPSHYTHVCVSIGTGTTFIGLRNALPENVILFGYVPMKQGAYLTGTIKKYLSGSHSYNWQLFDQWHCGGFGKWTDELLTFMNMFNQQHNIPLDIVYTGKMMLGIGSQLQEGFFPPNAKILCIHTGGLQGNTSVQERLVY